MEYRAHAQLVLGAPLPEGCPLPEVAELLVCVRDGENDSNTRTLPYKPDMSQIRDGNPNTTRTQFELGSNGGSNGPQSYSNREFERFESFPEGITHTEGDETTQAHLPLDQLSNNQSADQKTDAWWKEEL